MKQVFYGTIVEVQKVFINRSDKRQQTILIRDKDDNRIKRLTLFEDLVNIFLSGTDKGVYYFEFIIRETYGVNGEKIIYYNVISFKKVRNVLMDKITI